jgi:hypothetical protein
MSINFAGEVSLSYSAGMFNMPWNLTTYGRRLYFPSEGSHAEDFIALKNLSSLAGFKHVNLGSSDKHDSHYTTDNDLTVLERMKNFKWRHFCEQ